MRYEEKIEIPKAMANIINGYLDPDIPEHECLHEDDTISHTITFPNGIEMDVKCCGVQYNPGEDNSAWTEAVLFLKGHQVACSEPADYYFGDWELEYNGDIYIGHMLVGKE